MSEELVLARELGAMNEHLRNVDSKLGELVTYQKAQNGRVAKLESKVAVLEDAREHQAEEHASLKNEVKGVADRGRMWLIGVGGPVLASFVLVLTGHA